MELKEIKGVGEITLNKLKANGIFTVEDLLFFYPKNYAVYEINNDCLLSGEMTCISGIIDSRPAFIRYRKNINTIIFYLLVNNNRVKCIVFSQDYLRFKLIKDNAIVLYGHYQVDNKEFLVRNVFLNAFMTKIDTDYKVKDLANSSISKIVKNALASNIIVEETLPEEIIKKYRLFPLKLLVEKAHFPSDKTDLLQINRRRKYEEFFWYAMSLELLKKYRRTNIKPIRSFNQELIASFIKSLPYELTIDQNQAILDITKDIKAIYPMNRLIQGDVGCGKSIVAVISAIMEIMSGYQVAIMVPTELLAMQHYQLFTKLLASLDIKVALLVSDIKKSDKEDILYRLIHQRIDVIIGTHALIEDKVLFHQLGLIIIDEQHRFGVNQRQRLVKKYENVDCLYLTATPIPRTLGLTEFGDLDISSIHSMPTNRLAIDTHLVDSKKVRTMLTTLKKRLDSKEQMYVVVPIIEENKNFAEYDLEEAYQLLKSVYKDYSIGIINGKMSQEEKDKIMLSFKLGVTKILLSTTVIEVGLDVPNATMMVVLDADHFGLAQIHQLRGRVGRSALKSDCYLVNSDLDNKRLKILASTNDGFEIAVEDFKLRGPGDYLGEEQSGFASLEYSDFVNDLKIWQCAKEDSIVYCEKFLAKKLRNLKFKSLLLKIEQQKGKIN